MATTLEAHDPGCGCLCYCEHPETRDQCLHTGQVAVTVLAARAGRSFPARVRVCHPCADVLRPRRAATEPAI